MSDLTPPGPASGPTPDPAPPYAAAPTPYGPYGGQPDQPRPATDGPLMWTGFGLSLVICLPPLPLVGAILGGVALARKRIETKWPAIVAVVAGLLLSALQAAALPGVMEGIREGMREEMGIDPDADTPTNDLRVGDCFNDDAVFEAPAETYDIDASGFIELVPCNEAHQFEVFHLVDVPGDEFPGTARITREVRKCFGPWRRHLGSVYRPGRGRFELSYYYPTKESWEFGDRRITCSLYLRNGRLLSASQRQ